VGHTPVPPYTIHFHPSSSGTILAGHHPSPTHSGMSGVHEGSYDLVLSTYQSLGGPNMISSQGDNQHPMPRQHLHLRASSHKDTLPCDLLISHAPTIGTSHGGCLGRTPPARLVQRFIVRSCPIDTTLTTHPRHMPRSPWLLPHYQHQVP
jgi:hypothetical protein